MLDLVAGTAEVPTKQDIKSIYFDLYPKGLRDRWKAVPRDINDKKEHLITITRFTKMCYELEKKSGKRVSDGQALKRPETAASSKEGNG